MMDAIILKYNYVEGGEDEETALTDEIRDYTREHGDDMKIAEIQRSLLALEKQLCVPHYPSSNSKPYWMASTTLREIKDVMR
jgi:hypothetical protein